MNGIRSRRRYANVVASVALFAALGGGAYAAATVGPNDIENDAVRTQHVATNAVRNGDVLDLQFHELPLKNGWETATVFSSHPPAYAIDAQGVVHLRGAMRNPDNEILSAFTLPPEVRPEHVINVPTATFRGVGRLLISAGGEGSALNSVGGDFDALVFTSLEGISYPLH